ncbi:DUF488 family protein [Pedobacter sp. LMG 31464]|uniref:DUF488 family protein n=1 Tax=Pedobacter planticolens TaxID=2679964 RepID=A0A923ITP3_9SPHI|nr:DUF488 family protein [Pedobacter planticolens]MBB2143878.1 DUF488 family protein [Pedobacter planticolens]
MIKLKRIYEPYHTDDGYRILIDRLWPRGMTKEAAHVDLWMKETAPSTDLRKWFNHEPEKWTAFGKAYREELKHSMVLDELIEVIEKEKKVTLLYAAKDKHHTHAMVLLQFIKEVMK